MNPKEWIITAVKEGTNLLSDTDKQELLELARYALSSQAQEETLAWKSSLTPALQERKGVFVTLTKGTRLRGCMGYIWPGEPLYQLVQKVAQMAAYHDPRFPPLAAHEVDQLQIEISVLSPLVLVHAIEEIEVGRDGLYIRQGRQAGVLLPQVALVYGWDRPTFLAQTCRKAGLDSDAWRKSRVKIFRFSAEVFGEPENEE